MRATTPAGRGADTTHRRLPSRSFAQTLRRAGRTVLVAAAAVLLAYTPASGQQGSGEARLLAYFPFDEGSVEEAARELPAMVVRAGGEEEEPVFGIREEEDAVEGSATGQADPDGKYGEALAFTDGSRHLLVPLDLDFSTHPQVTVSMWVKVGSEAAAERGVLLSTGRGADRTPGLSLQDRHVVADAGGQRLPNYAAELAVGEWTHVAAIWETDAERVRVYTGGAGDERTGLGQLDPTRIAEQGRSHSRIENPLHPEWAPTRHLVLGALTAGGAQRLEGISIDEVRIWSGALTEGRLADIMTAQTPPPLGPVAPAPPPPTLTEEAEEMAEEDFGPDYEGMDEEPEGDEGAAERDEGAAEAMEMVLSGDWERTGISGASGDRWERVDLGSGPLDAHVLNHIGGHEWSDRPCELALRAKRGDDPDGEVLRVAACGASVMAEYGLNAQLPRGFYANALRICDNDRRNQRMKGIRILGRRVERNPGTGEVEFVGEANSDVDERPNCRSWQETVSCGPGQLASGVIARISLVGSSNREQIVGLQLVCRDIELRPVGGG